MDKRNLKKIELDVDSGPICYLDREWSEYHNRVTLVLDEFEQVLGQPLVHAITNAGYRGERSEEEYLYSHIARRIAEKVSGLSYYAITGEAEQIIEEYDIDDPAKFWIESLDSIKKDVKKQDVMDALSKLDYMLRHCVDEISEIDMFAMKAIDIIQKNAKK